jgi:hypothetical protein
MRNVVARGMLALFGTVTLTTTGMAEASTAAVNHEATAANVSQPPTVNSNTGCNNQVCIDRQLTGSGYRLRAYFKENIARGHFHFWGPSLDTNSAGGDIPWGATEYSDWYYGKDDGWACVEGWKLTDHYESIGLPCKYVGPTLLDYR